MHKYFLVGVFPLWCDESPSLGNVEPLHATRPEFWKDDQDTISVFIRCYISLRMNLPWSSDAFASAILFDRPVVVVSFTRFFWWLFTSTRLISWCLSRRQLLPATRFGQLHFWLPWCNSKNASLFSNNLHIMISFATPFTWKGKLQLQPLSPQWSQTTFSLSSSFAWGLWGWGGVFVLYWHALRCETHHKRAKCRAIDARKHTEEIRRKKGKKMRALGKCACHGGRKRGRENCTEAWGRSGKLIRLISDPYR